MTQMITPEILAALMMIIAVAAMCLVDALTPRPADRAPSFAGIRPAAPRRARGWTVFKWRDNTPMGGRSVRCGRAYAAHSPMHSPFFRPAGRFAFFDEAEANARKCSSSELKKWVLSDDRRKDRRIEAAAEELARRAELYDRRTLESWPLGKIVLLRGLARRILNQKPSLPTPDMLDWHKVSEALMGEIERRKDQAKAMESTADWVQKECGIDLGLMWNPSARNHPKFAFAPEGGGPAARDAFAAYEAERRGIPLMIDGEYNTELAGLLRERGDDTIAALLGAEKLITDGRAKTIPEAVEAAKGGGGLAMCDVFGIALNDPANIYLGWDRGKMARWEENRPLEQKLRLLRDAVRLAGATPFFRKRGERQFDCPHYLLFRADICAKFAREVGAAEETGRFSLGECDWCKYNTDTTGQNPPRPAEGKCRGCGKPLCHMCARADGLTWHFPPGRCGQCHQAECREVPVEDLEKMLADLLDPENGGAGDCLAELVRRAKKAEQTDPAPGRLMDEMAKDRAATGKGRFAMPEALPALDREPRAPFGVGREWHDNGNYKHLGDFADLPAAEEAFLTAMRGGGANIELYEVGRGLEDGRILMRGSGYYCTKVRNWKKEFKRLQTVNFSPAEAHKVIGDMVQRARIDRAIPTTLDGQLEAKLKPKVPFVLDERILRIYREEKCGEIARDCLELIAKGWTQGAEARNKSGAPCKPHCYHSPVQVSAGGAIEYAVHNRAATDLRDEMLRRVASAAGADNLQEWNDDPRRKAEDVAAAFRAVEMSAAAALRQPARFSIPPTAPTAWTRAELCAASRALERRAMLHLGIIPGFILDSIRDATRTMEEGKPVLSSALDAPRELLAQIERQRPENWDNIVAKTRDRHTNYEMPEELRELLESGTPDEREAAMIWEDDYDTAIRWMKASRLEAKNYANTRLALRQVVRRWLKREDDQRRNWEQGTQDKGRSAFAADDHPKVVADLLAAGAELAAKPGAWIQNPDFWGARRADGVCVPGYNKDACQWVAQSMIYFLARGKDICVLEDARKFLRQAVAGPRPADEYYNAYTFDGTAEVLKVWNDAKGRKVEDVIAAFRKAAKLARRHCTSAAESEQARQDMKDELRRESEESYAQFQAAKAAKAGGAPAAGRFSLGIGARNAPYILPERYVFMMFLSDFVRADSAKPAEIARASAFVQHSRDLSGAVPTLCRVEPARQVVVERWQDGVDWAKVQIKDVAQQHASENEKHYPLTLPRPEFLFLHISPSGLVRDGQYPRVYQIGGEMGDDATTELLRIYYSIVPQAHHTQNAEAHARQIQRQHRRFSFQPSPRPLITPLYGPPASSKIKDPRYPIPVKIREAKDAERMMGFDADALADVIFTAFKQSSPVYKQAALALDALRIRARDNDPGCDPRPRGRRW